MADLAQDIEEIGTEQEAAQESQTRAQLLAEFDRAANEQREFNKQQVAELRAKQKETAPDYGEWNRRISDIDATAPPRLERPPQAPNTQRMLQPTNLQKTFGMASIFALVSVGLAKGAGSLALNAFGGFMEGAHQGNLEQAKAALTDFNSNMDRVKEANDAAMREYNAIMANKKLTLDAKERQFHMKALEFQDELAIQRQAQGGMVAVHSYLKDKAIISHNWALESLRYKQIEAQMARRISGAGTARGGDPSQILGIPVSEIPTMPEGAEYNEAFLQMLPPAQQQIVKSMAEGKLSPGLSGFGAALRGQYTQAATIYKRGFNAQTFGAIDKTMKENTPGGRVGANVLAVNTLPHHLDQYVEAFSKLNNSQMQRWNSTRNKLQTEFGDPALQNLQVPLGLMSAEIARVVKGGTAAPTEEEIRYWQNTFNSASSPEQMRGFIWEAMQGVGGRLAEVESANRKALRDPSYRALSPEAVRLIIKNKPKKAPTPEWLKEYMPNPADLSDLEKKAALTPDDKRRLDAVVEGKVTGAGLPKVYPTARNPQTGEVLIFKDGKWQKP